ncbi:MAG: polysaccharide biosynthesis C-terminal domain-containing protein [Anaerolineae bacterium]
MIWFVPIGWINSLTNYVLVALDMQKPMRWAFAAGVSFNIIANLLFIPLYSYRASAVITIFSEAVLLIGFYILLRRALKEINWITLLWRLFAAAAGMIAVLLLLLPISGWLAVSAAIVIYPLLVLALQAFSTAELQRFAPLMPSPLRRLLRLSQA